MARYIALLRGVNLGPRNRIGMPALRHKLAAVGFEDVKTYLQSGNIVLGSRSSVKRVAGDLERSSRTVSGSTSRSSSVRARSWRRW